MRQKGQPHKYHSTSMVFGHVVIAISVQKDFVSLNSSQAEIFLGLLTQRLQKVLYTRFLSGINCCRSNSISHAASE